MMWKYLLMVLIPLSAISQTKVRTRVSAPTRNSDLQADKFAITPSDTTGEKLQGRIVFKSSDSTLYIYNGVKWEPTGTGGTGGSDVDLSPYAFKAIPLVATTTTNYTLVLSDASSIVSRKLAVNNTVTVPTNASVPFPVGTTVGVSQDSTGNVNVIGASGVTIISADGVTNLRTKGSMATLIKKGTNIWQLVGDLYTTATGVVGDSKIHLRTLGAGTNANIITALSYGKTVVIDTTLNITSDLTIPQGTVIEVAKGYQITTSGSAKLVIAGQLIAGAYQIFALNANVKLRPFAVTEIYPEWFGAQTLDNPRLGTVASGATDATAAFRKTVTLIESAVYSNKVFGAIVKLRGWYGITDQLEVHGSYRFIGTSQQFEGSGLRWLGTPDAAKSMIIFLEAEYGGCENMGFRGRGSATANGGLRAAIEVSWTTNLFSERGMVFKDLSFGNPIGYFYGDNTGGLDFERAILCSGGSGNNDFHTLENITVADTKIGIETETDQSVEWKISNYRMLFGRTMYKSGLGGSVIADRWYAESTGEGGYPVIEVGGGISYELRLSMTNFSSEYIRGNSFINTAAKVKLSMIGENFIAVNQNYQDLDDGFALIKGGGNYYDGEYMFYNTRFEFGTDGTTKSPGFLNNTPRFYIEQPGTSVSFKSIIFENCTNAKDIYFKFPYIYDANNSTYTNLTFRGEKNIDFGSNSNFYQQDKKIIVNVKNPRVTQGVSARWLYIKNLFDGETEVANSTVNIGEKGKTAISGLSVKAFRSSTVGGFINSIPVLPAKSIIKGVSVLTQESNILTSSFNYLTVGTVKNERMFGTIEMPAGSKYNTFTANPYATDTAENLIIKGYTRMQDYIVYTISGNTLSSNGSPFTSNMVGGLFRFLSGANKSREFLITGYTNGSTVTVSNPGSITDATGGMGEIQTPITGGKGLSITVTYEELEKYREQVDGNFASALPLVNAVAKTPVLNEKQLVFNGIDTTGFGGGSGGASGIDESDIVHKSGSETISGAKTFASEATFSNGIRAANNTAYIFRNAANSADIGGMSIGTDNVLHFSAGAVQSVFESNRNLFNTNASWLDGINVGNAAVITTNNTLGYGQVNSTNSSYYSLIRLDNTNKVIIGSGGVGTANVSVPGDLSGSTASFTGNVNVPSGTASNHAVNKGQLDAAIAGLKKVLSDADYTVTSSDNTLLLPETSSSRTLTLPAASTMANKELWIVCRSATTGRWILNGSWVSKGTQLPSVENFVNSGLINGQTYHIVSDGSRWYDIND